MCMFFTLEDDILKGRISTCSAISELTTFAFHYTLWLRGFWIWWILFAQLTISVVYCKEACKMLNICHRANIISFNSLDLFLILLGIMCISQCSWSFIIGSFVLITCLYIWASWFTFFSLSNATIKAYFGFLPLQIYYMANTSFCIIYFPDISRKKNGANRDFGKRHSKTDLSVLSVSSQVWRLVVTSCSLYLMLVLLFKFSH